MPGDNGLVLEDGRLDLENMEGTRLTTERLPAELRSKGLANLGQALGAAGYLEAAGWFPNLFHTELKADLSGIPDFAKVF